MIYGLPFDGIRLLVSINMKIHFCDKSKGKMWQPLRLFENAKGFFVCLFLQRGKSGLCIGWNDELMPQFPAVEAWLCYFCLLTPIQCFNMAEIHWEYMGQDSVWSSFWEMFTKRWASLQYCTLTFPLIISDSPCPHQVLVIFIWGPHPKPSSS